MATFALPCLAFSAAGQGSMKVEFEHFLGDQALRVDDVQYYNAAGQSFTVSKLKYYVSNMMLYSTDGAEVSFGGYYLIDEDKPDSKDIILENVPAGDYNAIGFTVGVDSLHNCSGAQSGALDPVNAMYWTWNTGYIFLKLEGKSPASKSPGHLFEFHIGGYKAPANCIRTVRLQMPARRAGAEIYIKADISLLLSAPSQVDFSKLSSVTDFHNAPMIADNYAHMFSIVNTPGIR